MSTGSDTSRRLYELPPVLDLRAAAPLADGLSALRGSALTIDAQCVERIGGQCLQVLLAAQKTWSADEVALSFERLSPAFLEGVRLMGLGEADFTSEDMPE